MPVVRSRKVIQRPQKINRVLSIKEFYDKRDKVLIFRGAGGLGDILMHRMMFEDFKLLSPGTEVHFSCPPQYHDAVKDHPFVDRVFGLDNFDRENYILTYNTTTACGRYEMRIAPLAGDHRSDIWASQCGIVLTRHNMHIKLTGEEQAEGRSLIEKYRFCDGPSVAVIPISAMENKNLSDHQLLGIVRGLQERGLYPFGVHTAPIYPLLKNDIPTVCKLKIRQWMGVINQADYVVSVDTAAFHCAGGMGKPVVGIFTFCNGETYGRYYPTKELVQGPCPVGYQGCYNWYSCPAKTKLIPCLTDVSSQSVLAAFDRLLVRFPCKDSNK